MYICVMKSVKKVLIESSETMDETIKHGSLTLWLDTSYRPEHHRRQWGIATSDFKQIKKGDKVYFHYLTLERPPDIPPKTWAVDYSSCYLTIHNGNIITLNDYIIVSIETQKSIKSNIIIPEYLDNKKSVTTGFVKWTHHPMLKEGDHIMFRDIAAFENEIEGEIYYVMEHDYLLGKII